MSGRRIVLIGFGNMGRALAAGWRARGLSPAAIAVVDPDPGAQAAARDQGLRVVEPPGAATADVVVIAVKPAQVATSLQPFAGENAGRAYLSIVAGKTTTGLAALLGANAAIVRAMPNTPAAIGQGVTVLYAGRQVTVEQRDLCADLMGAVGTVAWVGDERLMDAVTAVSGSGPAYVFLLIECLTAAGRDLGLGADLAAQIAVETVAGSGAYARASGVDAAELRRRVTSPQGTTQAALEVLQAAGGLGDLMRRAVAAAAARSRELSGD